MNKQGYHLLKSYTSRNRTLNSQATQDTLRHVYNVLSNEMSCAIDNFRPDSTAWTWRIPPGWKFAECSITNHKTNEIIFSSGHPLSVGSYSMPVKQVMLGSDLLSHVYCDDVPKFRYHYYVPDWSISMRPHQYQQIERDAPYRVNIQSSFDFQSEMQVLTATTHRDTDSGNRLLLVAHVDHPYQANDGLSGVAVGLDAMLRLNNTLEYGDVSLLVCPETIGSIAYFSRYAGIRYDGAIFLEMLGSSGAIKIQHSTRGDTAYIDKVATTIRPQAETYPFRKLICNDEMVVDGPGVDIPCISISRYPYNEYHTLNDNLDIISETSLDDATDYIVQIAREFVDGQVYKRNFDGPICLSANDMWNDNMDINLAYEQIMLELKNPKTVIEIAYNTGLDIEIVDDFIKDTVSRGLTYREGYKIVQSMQEREEHSTIQSQTTL